MVRFVYDNEIKNKITSILNRYEYYNFNFESFKNFINIWSRCSKKVLKDCEFIRNDLV